MAAPAVTLDKLQVLVAEDEYLLADDLICALRDAGAVPVGPVATVAQAEAKIDDGGIDAAVLDMNLRGETAFELAAKLAAAKITCIVVSGYSELALPPAVARLPRLEKPVNSAAVVRALAKAIGRGG